jgi:predicted ATPase with chaperone activity
MSPNNTNAALEYSEGETNILIFEQLAPAPTNLSETGLTQDFLADLIAKHLLEAGAATLAELAGKTMLPGSVIEDILHFMRQDARVEVLGAGVDQIGMRYNLTDRGRAGAMDAMFRSGYVGPAPIPLTEYARIVRKQSVHARGVTREMVDQLYADTVIREDIKSQLGLSMNSGRAVFVYGPAGTGKTYLTSKLATIFSDTVLIPYAIQVGDATLRVFDPVLHKSVSASSQGNLTYADNHDARLAICERPVVVSGGELVAEMLDVQFDKSNREYTAPLQLKANNGIFIIDDMGRQKVAPEVIFNRWIVPLEEKTDYLALGSGRHFSVPFDEVLIFSTNLHPLDLADEAFLRRIGYKIEFPTLIKDEYQAIWNAECDARGVVCDPALVEYVVDVLHASQRKPMLPCHPRDLIGIAVDRTVYANKHRELTQQDIDFAWNTYFVSLKETDAGQSSQAAQETSK